MSKRQSTTDKGVADSYKIEMDRLAHKLSGGLRRKHGGAKRANARVRKEQAVSWKKFLIRRAEFKRLVDALLREISDDTHFSYHAVEAIHESAEDYLTNLLSRATNVMEIARRRVLMPEDVGTAARVLEDRELIALAEKFEAKHQMEREANLAKAAASKSSGKTDSANFDEMDSSSEDDETESVSNKSSDEDEEFPLPTGDVEQSSSSDEFDDSDSDDNSSSVSD